MGSLPEPSRRDADPAQVRSRKTEAGGPKVSKPLPVAGGDAESSKCQTKSQIGQSHEGDSAEKTPGKNPLFLRALNGFIIYHLR